MIVDQLYIARHRFDFCIVGAGAAGIIAALELCRSLPKAKILLVEYGSGTRASANSLDASIQIDNLINHHPPYECTNKGLGGTTATWGGRCVMYDEIDFLSRPIIKGECTWDSNLFEEVQRFVFKAQDYFECGRNPFRLSDRTESIASGFASTLFTDKIVERWSMPTRFGSRYRDEIVAQKNLFWISGFEARQFICKSSIAESLIIRSTSHLSAVEVKASTFVICAGAQESTRILLRNPQLFGGVGAVPNSLGKYYQGHVSGKIASVQFSGDPELTEYGFKRESDGTYVRRRFQMTTESLLAHDLLNTAFWLDNPLYVDPSHRSGAMSFMYMAMIAPLLGKRLAPPAIAYSITKGKVNQIGAHVWNIVRGFPKSIVIPASMFWQRYCRKRKLPGVFLYSPKNRYALHFHAEQIPVPENRMELGPDGETLVIHYGLSDSDIDSVIRGHQMLDRELRNCRCGKLEYWHAEEKRTEAIRKMSRDGVHQCGTTRIADAPQRGVVDRDLKIWGSKNVYVCSSSVFPTSGQANPTFLIGVFAVRLAKLLKERFLAAR